MPDTPQIAAKQIRRRDLIEVLGATYAHSGSWRSPIQELIGKRIVDHDHLSDRQMFSSEREAVEHVRAMAVREAQSKLPVLIAASRSRRRRASLWLASNWDRFRRGSSGLLATVAIQQAQIDLYERILAGRYEPFVERIPDRIAIPAVLMVDTPVWVLETRDFPRRPAVLREDRISEVLYDDCDAESAFGFRARYGLAMTRGTFLYDHADTEGHDRLDSPGARLEVFVRKEAADRALAEFHAHVQRMLSASTGGLTALPPPSDIVLAIPEAPWEEHAVEAFQNASDHQEDPEMLKGIRTRISTLLKGRAQPSIDEGAAIDDEAANYAEAPVVTDDRMESAVEQALLEETVQSDELEVTLDPTVETVPARRTPLQEFVASGMQIRTPPGQGDAIVRKALANAGIEGSAAS